jgi:hypothetical protein
MKRLKSLNQEPHCTGSKSYARATHEHICVYIYLHLIYVDLINYVHFNTYSKIMFLFYLFMQIMDTGIPPTRAKSYIDTHTNKDHSYPNDVVKERCVCY